MRHPYSDLLMRHFMQPSHVGVMIDPTAQADERNNTCGDTARVFVRVQDDHLVDASFLANGCGPGIACTSYLLERAVGMSVEAAMGLSVDQICAALELPAPKRHAAELAVGALRKALRASRKPAPV